MDSLINNMCVKNISREIFFVWEIKKQFFLNKIELFKNVKKYNSFVNRIVEYVSRETMKKFVENSDKNI